MTGRDLSNQQALGAERGTARRAQRRGGLAIWQGGLLGGLAVLAVLCLGLSVAVLGFGRPLPWAGAAARPTAARPTAPSPTAGEAFAPAGSTPRPARPTATAEVRETSAPTAPTAGPPVVMAPPTASGAAIAPPGQAPASEASPIAQPPIGPYGFSAAQVDAQVDTWLAGMTTEEKVGQLLIVGFVGPDPAAARPLIRDLHAGSIVLYRNTTDPDQTIALTSGLQGLAAQTRAGVPLLISIDHEGGIVQRLRTGVANFPGNMTVGATFKPEDARLEGQVHGAELRALGINTNLAPVLDVNDEPSNPVIGLRSYGGDATWVAQMGRAYVEGLQAQGVMAVGKHFPGHGSATQDSHLTLPSVDESMETLRAKELVPFATAHSVGIGSIMTAHLVFPQLDPGRPATLSHLFLTDILRGDLGFDGVVMTDDTGGMRAITDNYTPGDAALTSVLAGADLVMVVGPWEREEQSYAALLAAAQDGRLDAARLDASVRRVLRAKAIYAMGDPGRAPARETIGADDHLRAVQLVADDGVTLVRDRGALVPPAGPGSVVVVSPSVLPRGPQGSALRAAFVERGWQAAPEILFDLDAASIAIARDRAVAASAGASLVVVGTMDAGPAQQGLVDALVSAGRPVAVVGYSHPYELASLANAPVYVAAYSASEAAGRAAARVLLGETPGGWLPVAIPGVADIGDSARGPYRPPAQ